MSRTSRSKAWQRVLPTEVDRLKDLLDPSPTAARVFTLRQLHDRARERASKTSELFDYLGLATKLQWLINSGAFDQSNMASFDPAGVLKPGRVTVIDVSVTNDTVKNLATADLLRKVFAFKILKENTPPTLIVIEEAHSFVSREKAQSMQATLEMLRNVTRRGRKRWLATAFVSQQPGHLPPEIFELCNTRIVHNLPQHAQPRSTDGDDGRHRQRIMGPLPDAGNRRSYPEFPATESPGHRAHPPSGQPTEI